MTKTHSTFTCQQCGYKSPSYLGKCPECGEWNSLVETVEREVTPRARSLSSDSSGKAGIVSFTSIKIDTTKKFSTHISELDRVLSGGVVEGQAILLAGEPGIGKSTLILELIKAGAGSFRTLYVCGEESPEQIVRRTARLGFSKNTPLDFIAETNIDSVLDQIPVYAKAPGRMLLVVDSIQTVWSGDLVGAPGSVGQVRECAYRLLQKTKALGIPLILVGQVTKEGAIAGPKTLEHLVDTVLYIEGSRFEDNRIIRVTKNRFGTVDEVGVFQMGEKGLSEVSDPSTAFYQKRDNTIAGKALTITLEGSRPLLVEIQALVSYSDLKSPRRIARGVPTGKLLMISAILAKHLKLPLERFDVYVNVLGGLTVSEPAVDLAVALSIYSSFKNVALPEKAVSLGELSLLGEIVPVKNEQKRIKEAQRLKLSPIFTPSSASTLQGLIRKLS